MKHGEYSKKLRKYYNADTGKWINRILPSMDKGRRTGVRVYKLPIDVTEYFETKYVDRVKYFLTYIIRSMFNEDRNEEMWVNISTKFVRTVLSNEYKSILPVLQDLNLIDVVRRGVNQYDSRKQLYYFIFNTDFLQGIKDFEYVYNTALMRSLKKHFRKTMLDNFYLQYEVNVFKNHLTVGEHVYDSLFQRRIERKQSQDRVQYFWDSLSTTKHKQIVKRLTNDKFGWTEDEINKYEVRFRKRYAYLVNVLESTQDEDMIGIIKEEPFADRILNPIIRLDREFRDIVLIDNSKAVEYDMSTGYASLLYLFVYHLSNNIRGFIDEVYFKKYYQIDKGVPKYYCYDFIEEYDICFGSKSMDFYHRVGLNIYRELKRKEGKVEDVGPIEYFNTLLLKSEHRDYIKDIVLRLINSNPLHMTNTRFIGGRFTFEELSIIVFGEGLTDLLNDIKSKIIYKDKKRKLWSNVTRLLMKLEVKIMREVNSQMLNVNIPYVNLHDGMLVSTNQIDIVKSIVEGVTKKHKFITFKSK